MGQPFLDVPPPALWQDFERLTHEVCKLEWDDPDATLVGRSGQAQGGLDIVGRDRRRDGYWRVGVQCKRRNGRQPDGDVRAGGLITLDEIKAELAKVAKIDRQLSQFALATTAAQDAQLQQAVAAYSSRRERAGRAPGIVWFWEWFLDRLNRRTELLYEFYPDVLRARNEYDAGAHIASVLRSGFDRPLMRTPFHLENTLGGVADGIARLQQLLAIGKLKDADGETVASSPAARQFVSAEDRAAGASLETGLQRIRDEFVAALRHSAVRDRGDLIEIHDPRVSDRLNQYRADVLRELNDLLARHNLQPIESPLLSGRW